MRFEFATAARVVFGAGTLGEVGPAAAALGRRALVVTGRNAARAAPLLGLLAQHGVEGATFPVAAEPTLETVRRGLAWAREGECDLVIGFGGGSALDTAKAVAVLLTNEGDVLDYLEVIGRGRAPERPGVPCLAIPTTAGTGSEVTRNAVLLSPEHRAKVSLRSAWLLPRLAVVDPELTYTMPPAVTAATGLDALTQLVEPFVSLRANPLTDALCREGIARAGRSLRRAWECGEDASAREDMALAALLSGMALANAGLGAVHGFAAAIGGSFTAPHGAVCARLLPIVMEANRRALRRRAPESPALARYDEVARLLTGHPRATADDGVIWVRQLVAELGIPPLSAYGIGAGDLPELVQKAAAASSMRGNPIPLTEEEMEGVLREAL
ncbi:MAG: iron-containing alcohol dehydrogenase [Chloroflexia bacterium]